MKKSIIIKTDLTQLIKSYKKNLPVNIYIKKLAIKSFYIILSVFALCYFLYNYQYFHLTIEYYYTEVKSINGFIKLLTVIYKTVQDFYKINYIKKFLFMFILSILLNINKIN